jgi:hypothetical protein
MYGNLQFTTRTNAEHFPCPRCDAARGAHCLGAREKPRESCHAERHERARILLALMGSWTGARDAEADLERRRQRRPILRAIDGASRSL